jgi:hypothetical protein
MAAGDAVVGRAVAARNQARGLRSRRHAAGLIQPHGSRPRACHRSTRLKRSAHRATRRGTGMPSGPASRPSGTSRAPTFRAEAHRRDSGTHLTPTGSSASVAGPTAVTRRDRGRVAPVQPTRRHPARHPPVHLAARAPASVKSRGWRVSTRRLCGVATWVRSVGRSDETKSFIRSGCGARARDLTQQSRMRPSSTSAARTMQWLGFRRKLQISYVPPAMGDGRGR